MYDKDDRFKELDDFWDISNLVPKRRSMNRPSKRVELTEISHGEGGGNDSQSKLTEASTVIRRFIPPHSAEEVVTKLPPEISYTPSNSLIHKVTLYRADSSYGFYEEFCRTARSMWQRKGFACEYVDFFSYSPQYNQLSASQLSYYLWWRENIRKGIYIKTNSCYINLYTYELINIDGIISPHETREQMIGILENYSDILLGTVPRYIRWISDYSLIHRLPPPVSFSSQLLKNAGTLKEYFVIVPGDTPEGWARMLLDYCCSYDYKTSKFATEENIDLFKTHVAGALAKAVEFLSQSGRILSELPFGDCKLTVKAFDGAICSSENRYTIDVEYCSFSRSHELRFLVGDIVKYAENKIRAHIFVKSRLTVYSLPNELRDIIDAYFAVSLPHVKRSVSKKEERHDYDILYDLPKSELNLSNAEKIEQESWQTTKDLVETFEEDGVEEEIITEPISHMEYSMKIPGDITEFNGEDTDLKSVLGEYLDAVKALSCGNSRVLFELARSKAKSIDAVIDAINEISVGVIGDIIIDGDGDYFVVEDYKDML